MSNKVFIHAFEQTGLEPRKYSIKPLRPKKNVDRWNVYFEPIPGQEIDLLEFSNEMKRGKQFFSVRDGFLFGALVELNRMGKIAVEIA